MSFQDFFVIGGQENDLQVVHSPGKEKEWGGHGNATGEPSLPPAQPDCPYSSADREWAGMDGSSRETGFTFSLRMSKGMIENA